MSAPDLRDLFDRLVRFTDEVAGLPVATAADPRDIREVLEGRFSFRSPIPLPAAAREAMDLLERWSVHVTHPRYFGYFNPSVGPAGIVAEAMAAAINTQIAVWSHAPAAAEIERHVLRFLGARLGFPVGTMAAHFTGGGSEATHTAVLAALTARFPEYGEGGLAGIGARPRIYASDQAHESLEKIAHATGLGRGAVRRIPTGPELRLESAPLAAAVAEDRAAGLAPFLLVATEGTTAAGAIDPLPALADLAARERLWLHADAAWAGTCVVSPRLRGWLAGIERADSVTWDAHKWLSVPMAAGMFFARDARAVRETFRIRTRYMPEPTEGVEEPYVTSLQWSRRFIGLKLFLALAELGEEGLVARVEGMAALGELLRERLVSRGWRIVNDTPLPIACFARPSWEGRPAAVASAAAARIVARGRVWLSGIELREGVPCLRACISSFRTTPGDIEVLLEEVEREVRAP